MCSKPKFITSWSLKVQVLLKIVKKSTNKDFRWVLTLFVLKVKCCILLLHEEMKNEIILLHICLIH